MIGQRMLVRGATIPLSRHSNIPAFYAYTILNAVPNMCNVPGLNVACADCPPLVPPLYTRHSSFLPTPSAFAYEAIIMYRKITGHAADSRSAANTDTNPTFE